MKIEIVTLGTWGSGTCGSGTWGSGSWGGARLLAEYDPEDDAIRIDAGAVERVRRALGDAEAERFVRCAVAHERYHCEHPGATEAQAHGFARAICGADPRDFEAVLR